jgi:hypothetical protein
MPRASTALLSPNDLSGLPFARRVIRNLPRDSLLLPRSNIHRFIDPEAPGISIAGKSGRSIVAAGVGAFSWTTAGVALSANDAAFNGRTVFNFTGLDHNIQMGAGPAFPASFSFLTVLSVPASVLSDIAANQRDRTIFATNDTTNGVAAGPWLQIFSTSGGEARGFAFYSRIGSGGGALSTNAATLPDADVPMLVGVRYNTASQTSRLYLNNGVTPAATKTNHIGTIGQEATRNITPASYIGTITRGWLGKLGAMLWMDDTGTDRMSDAEWAALVTAWNAYYRGV